MIAQRPPVQALSGGVFSPLSLAAPLLLFESDRAVYQDSARTLPDTANGADVNGLTDFSGNGNHPVTTSTSFKGTLKTNAVNGLRSVVFDGASTFFQFAELTTIRYAVFVVQNNSPNGVNDYAPLLGHNTAFDWSADAGYYLFDGNSHANLRTGLGWVNGSPLGVQVTNSLSVSDFTKPTAWSILEFATAGNVRAKWLTNDRNASRIWNGEYAAVYLYSAIPSDTDKARLRSYCSAKYGIALNQSLPRLFAFDGNSQTAGGEWPTRLLAGLTTSQWDTRIRAASGQTTGNNIGNYAANIAPYYDAARTANVLHQWEITNDLYFGASAAAAYANVQSYGAMGKATGYQVILYDCLDRGDAGVPGGYTTARNSINGSLAADFSVATANAKVWRPGPGVTYADMLVRLSLDANIGGDGAYSDGTYFNADLVHLKLAGLNIVGDYAAAAVTLL